MQKEVDGMTDVMDLLGGLDIGGSVAATPTSTVKPNAMDLLSDLLGNPSNLSQPPKPRTSDPFQDLLGLAQPAPQQPAQQQSSLKLYSANGLNISLATKKESPTVCLIKVTFQSNDKLVSGISFQVAVPKVFIILN